MEYKTLLFCAITAILVSIVAGASTTDATNMDVSTTATSGAMMTHEPMTTMMGPSLATEMVSAATGGATETVAIGTAATAAAGDTPGASGGATVGATDSGTNAGATQAVTAAAAGGATETVAAATAGLTGAVASAAAGATETVAATDAGATVTAVTGNDATTDGAAVTAGTGPTDAAMKRCLKCTGNYDACGKALAKDTFNSETCAQVSDGCYVGSSKTIASGAVVYERRCHESGDTCTPTTRTCNTSSTIVEECVICCNDEKCNYMNFTHENGAIRVTSHLTWIPLVCLLVFVLPKWA